MFLPLICASSVLAQIMSPQQTVINICQNRLSPYCQAGRQCAGSCNYIGLAVVMCGSADFSGNPGCNSLRDVCVSRPNSCQTTPKEMAIPSSRKVFCVLKQIEDYVNGLCRKNSQLLGCNSNCNGGGNCDWLNLYSNMCRYASNQAECGAWVNFCNSGWSNTQYCYGAMQWSQQPFNTGMNQWGSQWVGNNQQGFQFPNNAKSASALLGLLALLQQNSHFE